MTQVLPAIIPHTREQLEEEIKKVANFASLVQIDITDGVFVQTKTWPYNGRDADFFEQLKMQDIGWPRWEDVDVEVHLMVKNPEETILDWIHTGISSVVAHIEATDNFQEVIDLCKENLVAVGVAIKPSTDIDRLIPFVSQVDFIQVMGSDLLGRHNVPLDPKAVEVIKSLQKLYPEHIIAIDIGVNEDTEGILISAGADKIIAGGAIMESANPEEVFHDLESYGQ
jgi:ribulose-phosphate 3-epimerase